jgi:predicted amidohydrolase YtcJ
MALTCTRIAVTLAVLLLVAACAGGSTTPSPLAAQSASTNSVVAPRPVASATAGAQAPGSLILVGRIVTMDDPSIAEALLIEDGTVAAVGDRTEVLERAGDRVPVVDLGRNVAYPGFIDAHAHWIGDRDHYEIETPAEAMDAAASRGWTSISEQWVNPERLEELERLAADDALPLRVDAYLALNYGDEFLGDWYASREPGVIGDHLRVRGVKIHLDDGWGKVVNWEQADLTATIGRADRAGWQVSVHAMSSVAIDLVLDAFEAALSPNGPNPLHHRIEHALQVTDVQLARLVAMDIATVTHLEGASDWLLDDRVVADFDRDDPGEQLPLLARWRDFVDAGLHLAAATDAPWTFPDFKLTEDMGRPVDQVAAGMDGRVRTSPEPPPWAPGQLLTAEQGLRAVTLDAAWALGDEARRGHLAPGTLADVTILSGDVTAATPDEIRSMEVVATIVGGIPAHCADPAICGRLGEAP